MYRATIDLAMLQMTKLEEPELEHITISDTATQKTHNPE